MREIDGLKLCLGFKKKIIESWTKRELQNELQMQGWTKGWKSNNLERFTYDSRCVKR